MLHFPIMLIFGYFYQTSFSRYFSESMFNNLDIWFNLEYFKRYASFRCTELAYLPRIVENITVPFLKAEIGSDHFYVQDIRHHFGGNTQTIGVDLKAGSFNSYWYFRKHEAIEKGEIGFGERLSEYQMKERLGLRKYMY